MVGHSGIITAAIVQKKGAGMTKPNRRQWDREWERVLQIRLIADYLGLDLSRVSEWKPGREGKNES